MKTTVTIFVFGIILFLFASCQSNSIYFDMERQSVVRCKGTISKTSPFGYVDDELKLAQVAGICNPSFLYYKDL